MNIDSALSSCEPFLLKLLAFDEKVFALFGVFILLFFNVCLILFIVGFIPKIYLDICVGRDANDLAFDTCESLPKFVMYYVCKLGYFKYAALCIFLKSKGVEVNRNTISDYIDLDEEYEKLKERKVNTHKL